MSLLPAAGAALVWLERRGGPRWHAARRWLPVAFLGALAVWAEGSGWTAVMAHAQPRPVDLAALASFLDQPENRAYRYFTFGLGDQATELATLTQNGTP